MTKTQSLSEDLRFDPEKHQYWVGKKRVPSVSEILQRVGLTKNYDGVDPFYRDRGIATHLAIRYYFEGKLDPTSLDPAVKPCFEAFLAYAEKNIKKENVLAIEEPMGDLGGQFAGTPDLMTAHILYDWKCSKSHDKAADLQGQAYKTLVHQRCDRYLPFVVVELHDDGTFAEFNYGDGVSQWKSVLDLYHWRLGR